MSVDLNCGLRDKELRKLRWRRIDLVHKKQLTVGKSRTGAGTGRVIPLNDTVMVALEAHAAFTESTVYANVYVIIEPCSTFGKTKANWEDYRNSKTEEKHHGTDQRFSRNDPRTRPTGTEIPQGVAS